MDPLDKFPLLLLPIVAIGEILRNYELTQLIECSKISKRFATLIQWSGFARCHLTLDYRSQKVILKWRGITYELCSVQMLRPRIRVDRMDEIGKQTTFLNWEEEWMDLGLYVSNLFNCPIKGFHTGFNNLPIDKFQGIIDRIIQRQPVIQELSLFLDTISEKELKNILDKIQVEQNLFINIDQMPHFEYTFHYTPKIIRIINSGWFTMKNLQEVKNAVMIKLDNSGMTNADLNLVLNEWKAGEFSNLQYFETFGRKLDERTTILELLPPIMGVQKRRTLRIDQYHLSMLHEVPIHRPDGTKAFISMEETSTGIMTFKMMINPEEDTE